MKKRKITREEFLDKKLEELKKFLETKLPEEEYYMEFNHLYRTYLEFLC